MAQRIAHSRLQIEALEDRALPAGNVPAIMDGDTLRILGDSADHAISVAVQVTGFSALGGDDDGSGRLFGIPTDGSNTIIELNPSTGAEINRIPAPESVSLGPDGLAFDGHSLFYINGFG